MRKPKVFIVKDKKTAKLAASFSNVIADKYEVPRMFDDKDDLSMFSNQDKFLILSEKTIGKELSDPSIKAVELRPGVYMKQQGYKVGIYCDNNFDFKSVIINSATFAATLAVFPFLAPTTGLLQYITYRNKSNKNKAICLAEALIIFKDKYLDKYMSKE